MTPRRKTPFHVLMLGCLTVICLTAFGTAQASSLSVNVQGTLVDIQADQVPLIDILKAISEKTGISIKTSDSLREPVSLDLKGTTLEKCLRRLLANQSYTLAFHKTKSDQFIPVDLRIIGTGAPSLIERAPPPDDHMKRYQKDRIAREFGDARKLSTQISAEPLKEGPDQRGIRIARLSEDSFLKTIGLKEGDIVNDVNGHPVKTVQEFTEALQSASKEISPSIIRIERLNSNGEIDPIYIELH